MCRVRDDSTPSESKIQNKLSQITRSVGIDNWEHVLTYWNGIQDDLGAEEIRYHRFRLADSSCRVLTVGGGGGGEE